MNKPGSVEKIKIRYTADKAELVDNLCKVYNDALIRYLSHKLQSEDDAREVAQEAYLRILGMEKFTVNSSMPALLFKIASNLAIDRLRRETRYRKVWQLERLREGDNASSERHAIANQELEMLSSIVKELPPKCRKAFLLCKIHDYGFAEIAENMKLSERMVRLYVTRAINYCRLRLDEISSSD